jgi:hypothetical protein
MFRFFFFRILGLGLTPHRELMFISSLSESVSELKEVLVTDSTPKAHRVQDLPPSQAQEDSQPGLRRQHGRVCCA